MVWNGQPSFVSNRSAGRGDLDFHFSRSGVEPDTSLLRSEPTSAISSMAWAPTNMEFLIDRHSLHTMEEMILRLDVTNGTGGAITFNSVFDMVDKVEVFIGSQQVMSDSGSGLKHSTLAFLTHEEFLRLQPTAQLSTSYGAGASLADGASTSFYLPIKMGFLKQSAGAFFTPGMRQDIRVRFILAPANVALHTGATATINNATLMVYGRELDQGEYARQLRLHDTSFLDYRFLDMVHQTIPLGSETNGVTYSQQLNAITGLVAFLVVVSRAPNPTGSGVITYRGLRELEVTDASGQNLHGGNPLPDAFLRGPYTTLLSIPGQYLTHNNVYILSFSTDPTDAVNNGSFTGAMPFDGTQRLRYRPAADNATGQLDVYALVYKRIRVNKGIVEPVINT